MRLIDADAVIAKMPSEEMIAKMIIDSAPSIQTKQVKYYDEDEQVWKIGSVIVE